jgi:hypothetical protein
MTRSLALWALAAVVAPGSVNAEPHLSARSGLRCARCHTSPTGGGKRTPYGTLYSHTSLPSAWTRPRARVPVVRDGDSGSWVVTSVTSTLATGEVTPWLGVGADLRVASDTTFAEDDTDISLDATEGTLYLELRPWPDRVVLYLDEQIAAGGAQSREAWALIRGPWSTYLRGGWLLPPFGIRLLDDDTLTRRATGANFANPDMGLELGLDVGPVFGAVAMTNGNFAAADNDPYKAFWALLELNLDVGRVGLSGHYNPSEEGCRAMMGGHVAARLGRLVLQGELDLISDRPADRSQWRHGVAGMAELDLLVTRGVALRAGYDYHDASLELPQDRRQRIKLGVDLFPLRMAEVKLYYLLKQAETAQPLDDADRLEVVLHVYL